MKKRLLFVDDEPMVLQGLQRLLRPLREEWEMDFAGSGASAPIVRAAANKALHPDRDRIDGVGIAGMAGLLLSSLLFV